MSIEQTDVATIYTGADMLREIRKPGKVHIMLTGPNDTFPVLVQKGDLLDLFADMEITNHYALISYPHGFRKIELWHNV